MEKRGKPEKQSFEAALEQLQKIVARLEAGDLALEEALKSFEEGVRLTRQCQDQLTAAEQRVEVLLKASMNTPEEPPETKPLGT